MQMSAAELAQLNQAGGWIAIASPIPTPPVVTAPPPPPPAIGPGTIYDNGKLMWPGDWDGSSLKVNYADATKIPGKVVASMTSIAPWAYWLPYVLHLQTSQFTNLILRIKPSVAGQKFSAAAYTSVLNPDGTWKNDVVTGGVSSLLPYASNPDADGVVTYTIPLSALKAVNIDLYKIIVQDQTGLTGDVWCVVYAAFM
jgi:hypothetical protein